MSGWRTLLDELGLKRNMTYETIVTTVSKDRDFNVAPMGVIRMKGEKLKIRVYKDTETYRNMVLTREAVINLTFKVEDFYSSIYEKERFTGERFTDSLTVNCPRLRNADAYIEVQLEEVKNVDQERSDCIFMVKFVEAVKTMPRALCRCDYAVIESLIHLTRIPVYLERGEKRKAEELIYLINHYRGIVERICPGSKHSEVMRKIASKLEGFKVEGKS